MASINGTSEKHEGEITKDTCTTCDDLMTRTCHSPGSVIDDVIVCTSDCPSSTSDASECCHNSDGENDNDDEDSDNEGSDGEEYDDSDEDPDPEIMAEKMEEAYMNEYEDDEDVDEEEEDDCKDIERFFEALVESKLETPEPGFPYVGDDNCDPADKLQLPPVNFDSPPQQGKTVWQVVFFRGNNMYTIRTCHSFNLALETMGQLLVTNKNINTQNNNDFIFNIVEAQYNQI